jgi:hypothetical protein
VTVVVDDRLTYTYLSDLITAMPPSTDPDIAAVNLEAADRLRSRLELLYGSGSSYVNATLSLLLLARRLVNRCFTSHRISKLFSENFVTFEYLLAHHPRGWESEQPKLPFYRDHGPHQVRVAAILHMMLLGHRLRGYTEHLAELGTLRLLDRCVELFDEEIKKESELGKWLVDRGWLRLGPVARSWVIERSALIAGLCHDVGYPLNLVMKLWGKARRYMPCLSLMTAHLDGAGDGLEDLLEGSLLLAMEPWKEVERRFGNHEHDMLSALCILLSARIGDFTQMPPPALDLCLELAATAVYYHHALDQEPTLDIHGYPIAYILILADVLQEWGRTRLAIWQESETLRHLRCHIDCTNIRLKVCNEDWLSVTYDVPDKVAKLDESSVFKSDTLRESLAGRIEKLNDLALNLKLPRVEEENLFSSGP